MTTASDRVSAAKLWLTAMSGGGAPYLSAALYGMRTVETASVPTIRADDQWRVYINPDWHVEIPVLGAHLGHLVWHLLRDHAGRARSLDVGTHQSQSWSTAADLTVSQTLDAAGHPLEGLADVRTHQLPPDLAVEQYFALIDRLATPSGGQDDGELSACGSSADGLRRPYEIGETPGIDWIHGEEIRRQIAIAFTEHMRGRGDQAGEWGRWVEQILEPKVPWQQVLSSSVRRAVAWTHGNTHTTYRRLSRRATPGVVLPGMRRAVPTVAIVVDTSGSMDDGLLSQALGEVDGVLQSLGTAVGGVQVYSCDVNVHSMGKVTKARDLRLVGGGGTDLRNGIEVAVQGKPRPDVIIVLTDGETAWPSVPPAGCTVVAVLIRRQPIAFCPSWAVKVDCDVA